jgi:hypothetical protein
MNLVAVSLTATARGKLRISAVRGLKQEVLPDLSGQP